MRGVKNKSIVEHGVVSSRKLNGIGEENFLEKLKENVFFFNLFSYKIGVVPLPLAHCRQTTVIYSQDVFCLQQHGITIHTLHAVGIFIGSLCVAGLPREWQRVGSWQR